MQVIPKKIRTVDSTMPIKNPKICSFLPLGTVLRFSNVQNNSNSIFVILADWSLIGGSSICFY